MDTKKHSGTLDKLGIDPEMIGKLGAAGGIGDKLGLQARGAASAAPRTM